MSIIQQQSLISVEAWNSPEVRMSVMNGVITSLIKKLLQMPQSFDSKINCDFKFEMLASR